MKRIAGFVKFVLIIFLLAIGIRFWYENLDEDHRRFVQNLVKQIPELPGRYSV